MKKMAGCFVGLSMLMGCSLQADEFTKPRKEKKISDDKLREQCCRELGESVKSCAHVHKQLAQLQEQSLCVVEDVINGTASCPLVCKKGHELKTLTMHVHDYTERLAELESELHEYERVLQSLQKTN